LPFDIRSAIANKKGKTCSWAAVAPYTAYSLTVNDAAQSSDTANCPAFKAADVMADSALLTTFAQTGAFYGAGAIQIGPTATCVDAPSSAFALIPSLAIMVSALVLA